MEQRRRPPVVVLERVGDGPRPRGRVDADDPRPAPRRSSSSSTQVGGWLIDNYGYRVNFLAMSCGFVAATLAWAALLAPRPVEPEYAAAASEVV
mmetsp:Transcript_29561/g.91397  ORF Transcript_29561/g.91397 Transcript_29561/m.91397 type:complete len:94 (+) Transcript_29561:1272-1553(+)